MYIKPINTRIKEEYLQFWDEVLTHYDLVKIENIDLYISYIHSYFEYKIKTLYDSSFDWNRSINDDLKVAIKIKMTDHEEDFHNLVDVLRLMTCRKEIPWIVMEDQKELLEEIIDGRFLITFDIAKECELSEVKKMFNNGSNLREDHQRRIEKIMVSLQGKDPCTLKEIIGDSTEVLMEIQPAHLLKWTSDGEERVTLGSELRKFDGYYIERKLYSKDSYYVDERNFLANLIPGVLMVISGDPGMGKSTILKSLALKSDATKCVINWDLLDSTTDLVSEDGLVYDNPIEYLFTKYEGTDADPLVRTIFDRQRSLGYITVFIDSYDETFFTYGEKILRILDVMLKSNVALVITARKHSTSLLYEQFSITNVVYLAELSPKDINDFCKELYIPHHVLETFPKEFLKIPLYLNMIKTIRQNDNISITTICDLYEMFMNKQFDMYLSEINVSGHQRQNQKESILKVHTQLAVLHLFQRHKGSIVDDKEFVEIISNRNNYNLAGIVSVEDKSRIRFLHQTYADYLAAKWMLENKTKAEHMFKEVLENCYYLTLFKFLVTINVTANSSNWAFTENVFKEDMWGLIPYHWLGIYSKSYKDGVEKIKLLLTRMKEVIPDPDIIVANYIRGQQIFSLKFLLSLYYDIESYDILPSLIQILHQIDGSGQVVLRIFARTLETNNPAEGVGLFLAFANEKLVDSKGENCLHHACRLEDLDAVRLLILNRLDPNETNEDGETCLHLACSTGNIGIVQLLLENGGDPNLNDKQGKNCLHYAHSINNLSMVQLLREYGANPNQANEADNPNLHQTRFNDNKAFIRAMLYNGPDTNFVRFVRHELLFGMQS